MTQGFWKGLLHGAVISVAGLAALSLLTPLREEVAEGEMTAPKASNPAPEVPVKPADELPVVVPDATSSDTSENPVSVAASEEISPPVEPETTDSTAAPQGPQAAAVDLPVGSEFGRGDDAAPQMPAPMISDTQSRSTDAPAVSAPTVEPAPVAITDPGAQPAADLPDTSLTRTEEPETEDAPKPEMPAILETPLGVEAPEMMRGAEPDQSPSAMSADIIEDAGKTGEFRGPPEDLIITPVEAMPVETNDPDDATSSPTMPSPQLDLSTPPDLSDLRVLQE